ncbi:hypothetical protein BT63DRAFT_415935 [Microthyrium microscopicum]|uniref:DASH complex subunit ASK1 n=1 Tax=Microthyrium microscopicum TaxID=703497 RepID=A0A6A6U4L4_9PEZI|nr:hypothetical protein BT63DRAFT_415935 [Microthyrium microscopicum]
MARPSMAAPRNLTLTEELEKLEQSITLTLQEIDSNFAKAHRIVTTSILPIVERYAKNSEAVWEGSKFWKQFFEASGNVSFNNYAVPAIEDSVVNADTSEIDQSEETSEPQLYSTPSQVTDRVDDSEDLTITSPDITTKIIESDDDDIILSSPSLAHNQSTPRFPPSSTARGKKKDTGKGGQSGMANVVDYPSPYEAMRREIRGDKQGSQPKGAPVTPGKRPPALPDMTMTPVGSSPFAMPQSAFKNNNNKDTVLHQGMLGMTYRVAATPMTAKRRPFDPAMSSPLGEEPQLRPEIFTSDAKPGLTIMSPKKKETIEKHREERRRSLKQLTGRPLKSEMEDEEMPNRTQNTMRSRMGWDSDDDEIPEFSPPKTLRFELGEPKFIHTPAREASRRIVEDLYDAAGGYMDDDEMPEEYSPSIVMKGTNYQDDTF